MNRPAVGSQSLRGIPNGFPGQQQAQQNRSASNRIPPSGKLSSNSGTWAFGAGNSPLSSGGLPTPRQGNMMSSFAQTIGASSQSSAQLDLSEFPSLSNNRPQPSQSTWAIAGSRNTGQPENLRLQQSQLSNQQQAQQHQEELFSPAGQQLSGSGMGFRFGGSSTVGQSAQSSSGADDFPPLNNRSASGEIGQDRLLHSFGSQSNGIGFGAPNPPQPSRNGSNGLLNALSGSNRPAGGNRVASPSSASAVSSRSPIETTHQGLPGGSETGPSSITGSTSQRDEANQLSSIGRDITGQQVNNTSSRASLTAQNPLETAEPEIHDPLAHMQELDKWGIKGFTTLMTNFPDYAALVTGTDVSSLGFDLSSGEPISGQIYSLFDNEPARPPVPSYTLPDCYRVSNVAQLDSKLGNFNDEALMFMFYSNPGGLQQIMAATELHNRHWRYHKKLQLWLTKDDLMQPQPINSASERGYYIFFDIKQWARERRELTLVYDDLEQSQPNTRGS